MDLKFSIVAASKLVYFEKIGSTNSFLIESAAKNPPEWPDGSVVCAGEQTAGRGRNDRAWESPAGSSLSSSVLIREPIGAAHWYGILLAMALVRSMRNQGVNAGLKWPNDVMVEERKVSGLLGQSAEGFLVIGIGLNLEPVEIADSVSLSELGLSQDYDFQLSRLLTEFHQLRAAYENAGVAAVLDELRSISLTLGRRVRVHTEDGVLEGFVSGIDDQGRLVIEEGKHVVSAGDIVHLRGVD